MKIEEFILNKFQHFKVKSNLNKDFCIELFRKLLEQILTSIFACKACLTWDKQSVGTFAF